MQKITIEPVTRIEGHAKVTIHVNDQGSVDRAYFHVNEWRGFEKFCEGRPVFEMTQITPRICGICPVSHHLAAMRLILEVGDIAQLSRVLTRIENLPNVTEAHRIKPG